VTAQLSHAFDHKGERASYLPAVISEAASPLPSRVPSGAEASVAILPWQGSADIATLARANGLARFSAEKQQLSAGALVEVLRI
jgi:molybdopterin biosynthesis enzyme